MASISQLMQETAVEWRKWIREDCPKCQGFAEISVFDRPKASELHYAMPIKARCTRLRAH